MLRPQSHKLGDWLVTPNVRTPTDWLAAAGVSCCQVKLVTKWHVLHSLLCKLWWLLQSASNQGKSQGYSKHFVFTSAITSNLPPFLPSDWWLPRLLSLTRSVLVTLIYHSAVTLTARHTPLLRSVLCVICSEIIPFVSDVFSVPARSEESALCLRVHVLMVEKLSSIQHTGLAHKVIVSVTVSVQRFASVRAMPILSSDDDSKPQCRLVHRATHAEFM